MKSKFVSLAAFLFLIAVLASPMWADPLQQQLDLTVIQPVELPGHVLAPGDYTITSLDSGDAVLVRKADGSQGFFEIVGRTSRLEPADGAVVNVDREQSSVPRITDYYFPGETTGIAFYYPVHAPTHLAKKPAHQGGF